jgi:putative transposase
MNLFQNKYRIPSTRLQGYDYGSHGLYFITICTHERLNYFGTIKKTDSYALLEASPIANTANEYWLQIPQHFPFVEIDEFTIMPNHLHGILFFNKPDKEDYTINKFGTQSQNLASVIRGFKASLKRYANQNDIDFNWQKGYHDRIIRTDKELENVRSYIINNPANWLNDEHHNP